MGSCACVEIIAAIAIRFVIGAGGGGGDEVSSAAQWELASIPTDSLPDSPGFPWIPLDSFQLRIEFDLASRLGFAYIKDSSECEWMPIYIVLYIYIAYRMSLACERTLWDAFPLRNETKEGEYSNRMNGKWKKEKSSCDLIMTKRKAVPANPLRYHFEATYCEL